MGMAANPPPSGVHLPDLEIDPGVDTKDRGPPLQAVYTNFSLLIVKAGDMNCLARAQLFKLMASKQSYHISSPFNKFVV